MDSVTGFKVLALTQSHTYDCYFIPAPCSTFSDAVRTEPAAFCISLSEILLRCFFSFNTVKMCLCWTFGDQASLPHHRNV